MRSDIRGTRNALIWPAVLLLAGLLMALGAAFEQQRVNETQVRERLQSTALRAADRLTRRLRAYEYGLLGTRSAVVTAGKDVEELSRDQFRRYAASLDIPRQFPGLHGLSFARRVPVQAEADFVAAMRREGFRDFRVRQLGPNPGERFVIQYIEPLHSNAAALGLDMASDPERRDAALAALRSGEPRLTAPITLLQAPREAGRAFVLMLPIYRTLVVPEPARRDEQTFGWAVAQLVIDEVLHDFDYEEGAFAMALTDITPRSAPERFFTSSAWQASPELPVHRLDMNLYGRHWLLQAQALPAFAERLNLRRPASLGAAVGAVFALLALLLHVTLRHLAAQRAARLQVQQLNATLEQQVRERTAELEQALAREHAIFTSAGSAIVTTDLDGHVTGFNPAAEGMFGLPAAQALGRYFMELTDAKEMQRKGHLIPREVREHTSGLPPQAQAPLAPQPGLPPPKPGQFSEWTYVRADGTRFPGLLNASPLHDHQGAVTGFLSVIADLTERRAAEEARGGFENVGRALPGVLFTRVHRGAEFRYGFFSESAQRYLGVSREELMADRSGRLWLRNVEEADARRIAPLLSSAVAQGRLLTYAYRVRGGDGQWRTLQAMMVPRENGSAQERLFDGIALDISELVDARTQALRASEAKDRFLAFMSHELRTPLNGILGFAQLLEAQLASEDTRCFATHIHQAGQNLLRILNDVLDLSKIEAGRLELEQLPFRIESVVQACQGLFAPVAAAKGIGFEVSVPTAGTPELLGDATRLQQVLANLLSNAIKFTQAGHVSLGVGLQTAADGTLLVQLQVRDTGIGLSAEQQQHLFEPFQQAEASTARRYGGTGLGLWICRSLVQAMNGELALESAPGRGTSVRLTLPFKRTGQSLPAPSSAAKGPEKARTERALRVLVVDDIDINRELLRSLLQHRGHVVEEIDNGETAVERVAAGGIDLVLMDIEMPDLDGMQATRRIRALPSPAGRVPIWAVTGRAYEHDVAQARAAGVDGHMSKPVSFQVLCEVLQAAERDRGTGPDGTAPSDPP